MNRVLQPRPLVVLGLNVWMGTAAGADDPFNRDFTRPLPGVPLYLKKTHPPPPGPPYDPRHRPAVVSWGGGGGVVREIPL